MYKQLKIYHILWLLFLFVGKVDSVMANGLSITNLTYVSGSNQLQFTISWQNSWRISSGPANWDAVWVFVKRQTCGANGVWSHAILSNSSAAHTIVTNGSELTIDAVADGMGVFIRRNDYALGNVASTVVNIQLTNSYTPNMTPNVLDNFKVIGLEMVFVPQGSFYAGDGRPTNTSNFNVGASTPVLITGATQSSGLGVFSHYVSAATYGCPSPLPATFPLGYNSFYCMKYEISEQNVVDYLNTLTYTQQVSALSYWGTGSRLPNQSGQAWDWNSAYNNITISTAGTNSTIPAIFSSNYPYHSCGSLDWVSFASYLDWSGLRPMSEFEFEKACRGNNGGGPAGVPNTPIPYEYPWGNTLLNSTTANNYPSTTEYQSSIYDGSCNCSWGNYTRGGYTAVTNTNRSQSGATYYGIMDMGGNIWEQCVGGGSGYDYSNFTTANGNASLNANTGAANIAGWPTYGGPASGTINRGGNAWSSNFTTNPYWYRVGTSDREGYNGPINGNIDDNRTRYYGQGGRGVRTF